jgi:hypothetical protein
MQAMRRKAIANRRTPKIAAKPAGKPRMKAFGKEFWRDVVKPHADKLPSATLDELADAFSSDEEFLIEVYDGGDIRTTFRHVIFHMRLGMLFAREKRVELEKRVRELETSIPAYRGIWKQRTPYSRGSIVTFSGSMWHSNEDANTDKPGTSEAWTMCCKKGRDARGTP